MTMELSNSQLIMLRDAINADPALSAIPNTPDDNGRIADAFNVIDPAFWVYKSSLSRSEIYEVLIWPDYIGRSQGERDAFQLMLSEGTVNPSRPNVRGAFADIFSGGTGANMRAALLGISRRNARRAERLYADTAAGNGAQATPATLRAEGKVTYENVTQARRIT